jgi:hypothetical protein
MASSPLSLSESWKASAAGASVSLDEWTKCTGNGTVKQNLKDRKYLTDLMVPARERAARHGRVSQIETLEPGFFNSSFGQETPSQSEKQTDYQFGKVKLVPANKSPVVEQVEIIKADHVLVSTGLNGANPGKPGHYDQPSTYSTASGPLMPYEISQGVYDLVGTATRLGVHTHVSAGQDAATYRYDVDCATEWQHAAEKMCND